MADLARALRAPRGVLVCAACAMCWGLPEPLAAQADALEEVAWLTGCWMSGSGENQAREVWLEPAGGLMVGMARVVRNGVATDYELLVLRRSGDRLVLTAHPSNQAPADFWAVRAEAGFLRVENPDHDFPGAIEYRQPAPDSLTARVFGAVDDEAPAFALYFARGPCPGEG